MATQFDIALIGAGRIGAFHAETLTSRLPNVRLAAIADPYEDAARGVIGRLELEDVRSERDYRVVLADPSIQAVVIASPGEMHPEVIAAAAQAGKHIFCEKPLGYSLEAADTALAEVQRAGVMLQIGYQRRFDPGYQRAEAAVVDGSLGAIHLLRSITRDPELSPGPIPPWAIFRETLIHDFDVLRWLSGSEPIEVFAMADGLIKPDHRASGLLDTAVVCVRFANGAMGTVDGSFQAAYGYDVRAEVFGSGGMIAVGDGRLDSAWRHDAQGVSRPQARWFLDLFGQAYVAELAHFTQCLVEGSAPAVTGQDGRASLAMALAAIESVETGQPVRLNSA